MSHGAAQVSRQFSIKALSAANGIPEETEYESEFVNLHTYLTV